MFRGVIRAQLSSPRKPVICVTFGGFVTMRAERFFFWSSRRILLIRFFMVSLFIIGVFP